MRYLLRYGEIGVKGAPVRRRMERLLQDHIALLFRDDGGEVAFLREEGRLFAETTSPRAAILLPRAFGLVSASPVMVRTSALEDVVAGLVDLAEEKEGPDADFAVRVRRVGDHPFTSMEVARKAGAAIQERRPRLGVDLTEPDWEVFAEIRGERAYLYDRVIPGVGGLPLGSEGAVVAWVPGPEGAVAAWLMMKRGCYVRVAYPDDGPWAAALRPWDPDLRTFQVEGREEMAKVAAETGSRGFVYPARVAHVGEEDLRPAFYPLLGLGDAQWDGLRKTVLEPAGLA